MRPDSSVEAEHVGHIAASLGLPHETRRWIGPKPSSNVQAEARSARYALLAQAARELGAACVLTAHHQDDQIETHLLAATRKAGLRGLAGMRPARDLAPGLRLLRPFLGVPGARLKATTAEAGLPAVEDPSNSDLRYDRVRLRAALATGFPDRAGVLSAIARDVAGRDAADRALAAAVSVLRTDGSLAVLPDGAIRLDSKAYARLDPATRIELLARLVEAAGGAEHPPSRAALSRLDARLSAGRAGEGGGGASATLGGVFLQPGPPQTLLREFGREGPAQIGLDGLSRSVLYDGRLDIDLSSLAPIPDGARLVPFGALGLGNARERTMPVLLDAAGRPLAAFTSVLARLPGHVAALPAHERVSWRVFRDLSLGA